jgi:hypothetical protein
MPKCVSFRLPAVCAGVLAAVIVLETSARADDCLLAPNRVAAPGARWVYETDRATNRRCWYLIEAGRAEAAQAAEPSPYDPPQPPAFSSFFPWATGFPGSTQPDSAGGDPRAALGTRPDDARIDARPRAVRRPNAEALTPKPHHPPPAAHGDAEPQPRLTPTERDALFEEFLHWQARQKPRPQ